DQCHASIHTLLWNDRQLPCPRCQSQDIAPWVRPRRPGCKRSWCRSLYRRLSLMAVGIHGHTWAVLRLPSWHDLGAATGRRDAAVQPVLPRYTLRAMARALRGALMAVRGRYARGFP